MEFLAKKLNESWPIFDKNPPPLAKSHKGPSLCQGAQHTSTQAQYSHCMGLYALASRGLLDGLPNKMI